MHNSDTNITATRLEASDDFPMGIPLPAASRSEKLLTLPVQAAARPQPRLRTEPVPAGPDALQLLASRCLDVAGSLALLIVLLPVMIGLAVAIAIVDGGSPIFAHSRIGRHGRTFKCYKFRSMHLGAEQRLARLLLENPVLRREWERDYKLANDPRVTSIGRILRATSLDELPQLFNVLVGQMSLVGPRPVVAAELARYGRFRSSYLALRPGLTGLWQVKGRSDASYRRRVALDRIYARKKSIMLDCRILFATVPAVLTRRGAC